MDNWRKRILNWLPVLLMMGLIFIGSTSLLSTGNTSHILTTCIRWLIPEISHESLIMLQLGIRKAGHIFEYAALTMLILRAMRLSLNARSRVITGNLFLFAVGVAVLYAATDELHQHFVASRTGSLMDVGIDAIGASIGALLYRFWMNQRREFVAQ